MSETHILETKNVGLYSWRGGGRASEKVYCLYTHENVDIFEWPLNELDINQIIMLNVIICHNLYLNCRVPPIVFVK